VAPSSSTHSYRIIPSRDGLTFDPIDKVLPVVSDDVKELDFVGMPVKQSVRLRDRDLSTEWQPTLAN
jgi:hypothetical protein